MVGLLPDTDMKDICYEYYGNEQVSDCYVRKYA
jgi:hypothetical protein